MTLVIAAVLIFLTENAAFPLFISADADIGKILLEALLD